MPYDLPSNFSNGTAVNNLGNLVSYMNYVTDTWFAYGFLLVIFVITFAIGIGLNTKKSLLASSFITLCFSVYFLRIAAVSPVVVFICILGIIIGALGSKEGKY